MVIIRIYFQKHKDYRFFPQTHMQIGALPSDSELFPENWWPGTGMCQYLDLCEGCWLPNCLHPTCSESSWQNQYLRHCASTCKGKKKKSNYASKIRVDHYWFKQHKFAILETVKIKQNMVTCGHILPVSLKIIVFVSSIISITRLLERSSTLYKL